MKTRPFGCRFHLETQILTNENKLDALSSAMTGNKDMITDGGLTLAITTSAGGSTGVGEAKALLIHGCCHGTSAVDGCLQRVFHLVHTSDHNYLLWTKADRSKAVTGAIDIDHLTIHA